MYVHMFTIVSIGSASQYVSVTPGVTRLAGAQHNVTIIKHGLYELKKHAFCRSYYFIRMTGRKLAIVRMRRIGPIKIVKKKLTH